MWQEQSPSKWLQRPSKVVMVLERIVHDDLDATFGSGNPQDAGYQKIKEAREGSLYPCPAFHTPFLDIFPQPEAERDSSLSHKNLWAHAVLHCSCSCI